MYLPFIYFDGIYFSRHSLFNIQKRIGFATLFLSEKYLNLPSAIHSFRNSTGWGNRAAASRRALTEMVVSLGGRICDAFAVLPRGVQSVRRCMRKKESASESFLRIHLRALCTTFGKPQK